MKFHLVTWMLVLCGLTHAALLDSAGQPYRAIVVAPEAPDSVQLAARELQGFLKQVGAADLPVTPTADAKPVIYVGEHPELAGLAGELAELPSDGFLIRTVPDALVIAGRDYAGPPLMGWRNPWRDVELYHYELKLAALGEQGTLYGVYHFLEQFGGVRFYWPGELGTVVPEIAELQLPEIDLTRAPRFHYRYPWYSFLKNDRDGALWMHRVGFGGKAPVMIIHSYDLINRYKETHPEYFALADGKRAFGSECVADGHGHQCLTNPALIQQWVDDSIEILICPDPENTALCYQWIINSNGVCFDGRKISAAACDTKWESDAQIQVRREANRWIVDLRVPWAALGVNDPNFTANPVANFYRNRRAGGKNQAFAWSPTGAQAFFVPESFGVLELKK